jgi:hypothetical protein
LLKQLDQIIAHLAWGRKHLYRILSLGLLPFMLNQPSPIHLHRVMGTGRTLTAKAARNLYEAAESSRRDALQK